MLITIIITTLTLSIKKQGDRIKKQPSAAIKLLSALLLVCAALILIFTNVLYSSYNTKTSAHSNYSSIANKSYYSITDTVSNEEFSKLLNTNFLKRIKSLHSEMSTNPNYLYYDIIDQYITIDNTVFPDDFYYDKDGNILNAIQVSNSFFEVYNLALDSGRFFSQDEYIGDNKETIPVVLGSAYSQFYKIGDTINNAEYLFKDYSLVVVGFLNENSYYIHQENPTLLDTTIVMPSLNYINEPIPKSDEAYHQIALYTSKIEGVYVLNDKSQFANLYGWLQSITKEYGVYKLDFLSIPISSAYFLQCISQQYINTAVIIVSAFLILLFALFSQMSYYIYQAKKHYYQVLLICGASFLQIVFDISKSILLLCVLANLLALSITEAFISIEYSILIILISSISVILISSLYVDTILKKDYIG